ncbi:hypothetical protein AC1031_001837 [Aphanomyces cochlioides]|nr:hypothetical protein AC1031_001837 [Aphanomyces cochlioides]
MDENKRKHAFRFKAASDIDLLKEVIHIQPFDAHFGQTKSRWDEVGNHMMEIYGDKVTVVGCRKRFDNLIHAFKQDAVKSLRASGTEEEYNERDQLLQDISDLMVENSVRRQAKKDEQTSKLCRRESDGEKIRSAALGKLKRALDKKDESDNAGEEHLVVEKKQRRTIETPANDMFSELASFIKASNDLKKTKYTWLNETWIWTKLVLCMRRLKEKLGLPWKEVNVRHR